jgi:hypothetical protein
MTDAEDERAECLDCATHKVGECQRCWQARQPNPAKDERAAIVAWLRAQAAHRYKQGMRSGDTYDLTSSANYTVSADAIERGEHQEKSHD